MLLLGFGTCYPSAWQLPTLFMNVCPPDCASFALQHPPGGGAGVNSASGAGTQATVRGRGQWRAAVSHAQDARLSIGLGFSSRPNFSFSQESIAGSLTPPS